MKMMLVTVAAMLVLPASARAQDPDLTVEGQVGVVSDYRDRGYTLSDGEPALQGEVSLGHASGLYGGVWASSIDEYGVGADGDGAEVEVTVYAGWAGTMAGFDVDAGVWQTVYPDGEDVNYVEFPLQVGRAFGDTTLSTGLVWAPAQTGTGDAANTWVWTRADYAPQAWPVSLHAMIGREDGGFAPDGKTDWRVGLAAPVGAFTVGLDWVDSDSEDSALVGSVFRSF
ncbi:MAG: TorF family putative porin [Brevundimonas sp.]|uniref:TorF family putative porin n=1 Tax=Brevundimonas sp. TaxID=1871086 RepID=UPI00391B91E4